MKYAQTLGAVLAAATGGAFLLVAPLYVLDIFNATNYGDAVLSTLWSNVSAVWVLDINAWFTCGITLAILATVGTIAAKAQEVAGAVATALSDTVSWVAEKVSGSKAKA